MNDEVILYVPVGPEEDRLDSYATTSQWEAWCSIFDLQSPEIRTRYWHKAEPFRRWAKRQGWRVVKCKLVEVE